MRLMIDGDWLCYTAGFAGQKTLYLWRSGETMFESEGISALRQGLDEAGLDIEDGELWARTVCDPLDHVLHTVKKMIEGVRDKIVDKIGHDRVKIEVYLDGDGNFRSRRAKVRPYKGNRSVNSKPVLYNEIRQYLLDNWDAHVVHGMETDDQLAIELTESPHNTVCVAVDKDMLQVPGKHFNPNKGFKLVKPAEAHRRLWMQVLTGDATDNIMGCYKIGPAKAKALLNDADPKDYPVIVKQAFVDSIEQYGPDIYNGLNAEQAFREMLELVYLLRTGEEASLWRKYLL